MTILDEVSKLLTLSDINNWEHYDEDNMYSVCLINKQKSGYRLSKDRTGLIIIGDIQINLSDVLRDIRKFIVSRKVKAHVSLASSLTRIMADVKRLTYFATTEGCQAINEILKQGYLVNNKWIIWVDYIPINSILYNGKIIRTNPDELRQLGYGITEFKISIDKTLRGGLYCTGVHPNLSPLNNKFCMDSAIKRMCLTPDSLNIAKMMLGYVNMDNPYEHNKHFETLKHILKEK